MLYESRCKLGSILQNSDDSGLTELLTSLHPSNKSRIIKNAKARQEESRKNIKQKKLHKLAVVKSLKKYQRRPSKVPQYGKEFKTGTYIDLEVTDSE